MTAYTHFYIDKNNHTFADALTTFGLATLLDDLLHKQDGRAGTISITDQGAYYLLTCAPALQQATLLSLTVPLMLANFIRTPKNADKLPAGSENYSYDYETEKEAVNVYYAQLQAGVSRDELTRPQHWDILRAINPAALPGYNGLLANWWQIHEAPGEVLQLLFDLYAQTPNDYERAVMTWKALDKARGWGISPLATGQQLYNPDQGKGQNRIKATGLSIGNVDGFWLTEFLKAVGFYESAMTRLVSGTKDRKTFVIAPRKLDFATNREVMNKFLKTMTAETAARFDILAALRYTDTLLEHLSDTPDGMARLMQAKNIKQQVVSGFFTAFYKDLGNAAATMNLAFIALPGWVIVNTEDDIPVYRALLDELIQFTRQFDESHSDAFTLLQYLRDFVSGDDLSAFFKFTSAFPAYLMGMRERGKYTRQFSVEFIERLLMSTDKKLSRILASEGFQNIAYAIRQSTITAQYRKGQGDRKYDVRYGLGQELTRKARYPQDFIVQLSDFIHKYNAENAQVMEHRSGPYRRSIQTSDIDQVVALIDEYGSETVANLLIAYGYARTSTEKGTDARENEIEGTLIMEEE